MLWHEKILKGPYPTPGIHNRCTGNSISSCSSHPASTRAYRNAHPSRDRIDSSRARLSVLKSAGMSIQSIFYFLFLRLPIPIWPRQSTKGGYRPIAIQQRSSFLTAKAPSSISLSVFTFSQTRCSKRINQAPFSPALGSTLEAACIARTLVDKLGMPHLVCPCSPPRPATQKRASASHNIVSAPV